MMVMRYNYSDSNTDGVVAINYDSDNKNNNVSSI